MHKFGRFGLHLVPDLFDIHALKRGELGTMNWDLLIHD